MVWQFSHFMLDSVGRRLLDQSGQPIPIQPKAFRVLEVLVRHAPEVVSREELLVQVWGHSEFSISCLSQAIREIRRALGDDANQPSIIGTQHGAGYYLLVEAQAGETPTAGKAEDRQRLAYSLIAGAGLVLGLIASWIIFSNNEHSSQFEPSFTFHDDPVRASEMDPGALNSFSKGIEHLALSQWDEAIEQLELAAEYDPGSVTINFELTRAYFHAGYQIKAAELVEQQLNAYQPRSRMETIKKRAATFLVNGNLLDYGSSLSTLSDLYPERLDYFFELFETQLQTSAPSNARATLYGIIDRHPAQEQDARFWLATARLNLREGNSRQILNDAIIVEELAGKSSLDQIYARTLMVQAEATIRLGEIDSARMILSNARRVLTMTHDPAAQINLIMLEVMADISQGRPARLPMFINDGCQLSETIGYITGRAYCNRFIAKIQQNNSDPDTTSNHFDQAVQGFLDSGNVLEAAMTLIYQVEAELELYQTDGLAESLVQAEVWFSQLEDRRGLALVHAAYGAYHAQEHEFDRAAEHLETALAMFSDSPDEKGESRASERLARVLLSKGMPDEASSLFRLALVKHENSGDHDGMARVLVHLGELAIRTGYMEEGEELFIRASGHGRLAGSNDAMAFALNSLAKAAITRIDFKSAHQALDQANSLTIGNQRILASLRSTEGIVALLELDLARSERAFLDARRIREQNGDPRWLLDSDLERALLLLERGQTSDAIALLRDVLERLPPFATARDRAGIKLQLAESLIMGGNMPEARMVLDTVEDTNLENTNIALYFSYSSMSAALRQGPDTIQALTALRERAQLMGYRLHAMKVDLDLAFVMMRSAPDSGKTFVSDLINSARDTGIHCIVDRVDRLAKINE